jgi:hypothetical protein
LNIFINPSEGFQPTFRQRWSNYLLIIVALIGMTIGLNMRNDALFATTSYENLGEGIALQYPVNWLQDDAGDYVVRFREETNIGYKTTIQIATQAVGSSTSPRNVIDGLSLDRSQILAAYRILSINYEFELPDESIAAAVEYSFTETISDPFLQSIPIVVRGLDIIAIRRGQAIVITFLTSQPEFDIKYPIFERLLETLEF